VPFQWRRVWKVILSNIGLPSFSAKLLLVFRSRAVMEFTVVGKILSDFLGKAITRETSWLETLYAPAKLPFSGLLTAMRFCSGWMSVHCSFRISPTRMAVSLAANKAVPSFLPEPADKLVNVGFKRNEGKTVRGAIPRFFPVDPECFREGIVRIHIVSFCCFFYLLFCNGFFDAFRVKQVGSFSD